MNPDDSPGGPSLPLPKASAWLRVVPLSLVSSCGIIFLPIVLLYYLVT